MRALLAENLDKYKSFQNVRSAVLAADACSRDIEYVEAALQLAPETKLAYSWINRRLKLRRQRDVLEIPIQELLESYVVIKRLKCIKDFRKDYECVVSDRSIVRLAYLRNKGFHILQDRRRL